MVKDHSNKKRENPLQIIPGLLDGLIPHRRPIAFYNWCNKGRGMCYPVCGIVHITDPLLLM